MGPQDAIFLFKIHPTAMSRRDTKFSSQWHFIPLMPTVAIWIQL